jgi:hypothetical protein
VKASLVPSLVPEMVESLVPSANAPALIEEELPTLPRQPRPFATAEAPAPFYEPPPTSRSVLPPLSTAPTPEVIAAMSKRRPKHRYAVAAAALVVLGAGTLAARPGVSTWVAGLLKRPDTTETTVVAKQDPAIERAAAKRDEVVVTEVVQSATPENVAALPAANEAPSVKPAAAQPAHAAGLVAPVVAKAETAQEAAESSPAVAATDVASADEAPSSTSTPDGPTASEDATAEEAVVPGPFDKNAAVTALQVASAQASSCRKAGDPSGMARVVVTFAPSGRVTSATVSGAPFAGTQTGGCIASQFRSARVPAFEGALVTVTRSVVVQ